MMDSAEEPAEAGRFRLPVSGEVVVMRHPTGAEDLLLLEGDAGDGSLAVALASRVTRSTRGRQIEWDEMTVTDLDAMILRLRQTALGDRVRADTACQREGCGQRIDISFGVGQFLAHHAPLKPGTRGAGHIVPDAEPGWFQFKSSNRSGPAEAVAGVTFRLPTVADQQAVTVAPGAADALAQRCIRPAEVSRRLRNRVEAAMEKLAPDLSGELQGTCPDCGATVTVFFDSRRYCLRELRDRAKFIYQDVDLLARRYHWSEAEILAMPRLRRTNYVELARQEKW